MGSRSLTADQGKEPRVGELLRFCRKVAFLRQNVKVGCQKVNNLRASTCLFSVICDRIPRFGHGTLLCPAERPGAFASVAANGFIVIPATKSAEEPGGHGGVCPTTALGDEALGVHDD